MQYGESDLAFLTRLLSEEGIFFYDWHATDSTDQKLVLTDNVAGASALKAPLPFNPNISTEVSVEYTQSKVRLHMLGYAVSLV